MNQVAHPQVTRHPIGEPSPGRSSGPALWVIGLLVPLVVFGAFAAYAMLAPATFRATALITLEPAKDPVVKLPEPTAAAERLRSAALEASSHGELRNEFGLGDSPTADSEVQRRIEHAFTIVPANALTYDVHVAEADALRAQRLCNLLARHAAARAAQALGATTTAAPVVDTSASDAAQRKRVDELNAFVAAHPELTPPTVMPATSAEPSKGSVEAQLTNLRLERDQLQGRLARLPTGADTDNPYADPSADRTALMLQRRIDEINSLLRRAEKKPAAPTTRKVEPEVEREFQRLRAAVDAGATSVAAAAAPTPAVRGDLLTVRLSEAGLPSWPIDPDRKLLLLVGAAVALLITMLALVVITASRKRRPVAVLAQQSPALEGFAEVPQERRMGSDPPLRPSSSNPPPRTSSSHPPPGHVSSNPPAGGFVPPSPAPPAPPVPGVVTADMPAQQKPNEPPARMQFAEPERAGAAPMAAPPAGPAPPIEPAPTQNVGPATQRHPSLSGFAIVPAPMRTPLPPAMPNPPAAPEPPQVVEAAVTEVAAHVITPKATISPTLRPPPPEPRDANPSRIIESEASPHRTLTGPYGPQPIGSAIPTDAGAQRPPRNKGRTTQMLGSPIPPVVRRPSQQPREIKASNPSVLPGKTSSYSYVSSHPAPADQRPPLTSNPHYDEVEERSAGYLSTPAPEQDRGDRNREQRPARPLIGTQQVHSSWRLDSTLDFTKRRDIADQLFPLAVGGCFVLGITSVPEARTQKSQIAIELAFALAEARHPRILLIEGDFQWPVLHTLLQLEMPPTQGFSQQLRAHQVPGRAQQWTVLELGPSLHLMAEGIMRSPGLILSSQFEDSLRSFRGYYDFVLVDGPVTSSEVDCRAFNSVIDGVVLATPAAGSPWNASSMAMFPEKRFSRLVPV